MDIEQTTDAKLDYDLCELVGVEQGGTFDAYDIESMALRGLVVVSQGWGQSVYRLSENTGPQ